jgi:hypothetical protein
VSVQHWVWMDSRANETSRCEGVPLWTALYQTAYNLRPSQRWLWRMLSCGMWCCVDLVLTNISEEHIASIFRVENLLVPGSQIFQPWRWRRYVPPKRRLTQVLHSATSKKTTFFSVSDCSLLDIFFWFTPWLNLCDKHVIWVRYG